MPNGIFSIAHYWLVCCIYFLIAIHQYADRSARHVNEVLTACGMICYLTLLGHRKYLSHFHLTAVTFLAVSFAWFVGKRAIVARTLVLSVYVLSITGELKGRKLIRMLFWAAGGSVVFCVAYGLLMKRTFASLVDYFMVDMSRQYTLVYQFYCSIIGRQISVNRFDAILWILGFWVPRTFWPNKPYPFVNQLTYSLVYQTEAQIIFNVGWAVTCSLFSDLFDSFSKGWDGASRQSGGTGQRL